MKRASLFLVAFLIVSLVASFYQIPKVKAQEQSKSFGESSIQRLNWTKFWKLFNAHSAWDLEYNNGSEWLSIKSDLQIIKNYTSLILPENEWVTVNKSDASNCKITLNFTASYSAHYRLTFGIDLDVKNYTHKEGSWNYTISYQNHTVYFDWSDVKDIPNLIISHGIKPIGDEAWFWFRIRRNDVPEGANLVIDPSFGETGTGTGDFTCVADTKIGSVFTLTEDGTITEVHARLSQHFETGEYAKAVIYDTDAGDPDALAATSDAEQGLGGTAYWYNFTGGDLGALSAGDYLLGVIVDSDYKIRYTSESGKTIYYASDTYADGPEATWGPDNTYTDFVVSIYANYTTEAVAEYSEEFTEAIGISASLYLWRALFSAYTETITSTTTSYAWGEYPCFFTEITTTTEQLNKWKELRRFFIATISPTEQMLKYIALFHFFTETIVVTETSSFTMEILVEITEFMQTVGVDASLFVWKAKQVFFPETISQTTVFYKWIELRNYFTKTIQTSETTQFLKEKLLSITEYINIAASLEVLKETLVTIIEFTDTIFFDATIYLTPERIAIPTEVTTFGTVAFVIAIIALAIGVTALTAKKS